MNTHNAVVTRNTPTAFIYLLDLSGSMSESIIYEGENMSKNDALNKIVNTTLNETILRCRSYDKYNDYFDIAVLGYQGDTVINLLEPYTGKEGFCSINEIISAPIDSKTYNYRRTKSDGTHFTSQRRITQYIKTEPFGTTPMHKALVYTHSILQKWVVEHKGRRCFPPIVINITDGEMSDASEREMITVSQKIKRLSTENGNILFFTVHLSPNEKATPVIFPSSHDQLPNIKKIKLMYDMSSNLPKAFHEAIIGTIPNIDKDTLHDAKIMCYNTPIDSLTRVLEIGSMSKSLIR